MASTAPEPAEDGAGAALFPRAVGDQREDRASPQAPRRGNAGNMIPDDRSLLATEPCQIRKRTTPPTIPKIYDFAGLGCDGRHTAIGKTSIRRDLRESGVCADLLPIYVRPKLSRLH
jgi:hypothetical protein